uniref:Unc-13 homolog D (C. elegans) n=1 Tax=Cyprinus carpio TaxID=7962 RepID=A0A8C2JEH8_CYPCA
MQKAFKAIGWPLLWVCVHGVCVCVFTTVCVHFDGLNAEYKFQVWDTILGHTSLHSLTHSLKICDIVLVCISLCCYSLNYICKYLNEQAPIYCLMVTVKQAKGILGKDISGFSDPYCLLSILCEDESHGGGSSSKPQKAVVRDSAKGQVLQTTIKKQTLNPIWDETIKLEFEDISNAIFHIEMWDKDEEVSLVQKFDEFRTNIHGLKRMIKDAKKEKGQDDFLGNVVLKLKELHCTEDTWYNLEPRTETYPDRGQCHLQLKFIHKEVKACFLLYQQAINNPWKGELCGEGTALLEHYANQNDISPFLQDLAKWVAYSKLYQTLEVDSTVLFQQLTSIEYHWDQQELPYLQELGDSLHGFLQYGLCLVSKYRDIYPPTPKTTPRLQTLLRVLVQICKTRAFQKLNPAQFDLHVEVTDAVVNGTEEWFNIKKGLHQPMTKVRNHADYWHSFYMWIKHVFHLDFSFRGKLLQLTSFHEDFRDALPYWLNKAFSTTMERVEKAVQVDQLQPLQTGGVPIKHSSSAVDIAACLHPVAQLWEQLSWPDPEEAFMLMVKLTEDVCKIASTYCQMLKARVKELSVDSDRESAIKMLCVVVNDLEHLHTVLTRLPQQLNWAGLRERTRHVIGDTQFQNTLPSQLQHTHVTLQLHQLTGVRAVIPLMKYLEKELQYMNENLVQENFNSLLTPLWMNSVKILHQMSLQEDSNLVYFQRLLYALQCLEQCFHAEGNGLSLETLHTEEYKICLHFLQKVFNGEKYGAVTLITSYKRSENKLHVEVLNAVNLIPLDSNGSSDPFVQLSLEPKHIFPQVEPRSTKIKNCDLNPLFEESFEFIISLDQCHSPGACLMVTVLDHDTLRSDDFEGEAFLSLKAVPGVGGGQNNPTPAQIRLPLMHPKPNSENTLKLLEARKGEREAQAFVKLRRQREKKSQEI